MAQRSHVPKFGNWDCGNVPYTAYFENARKEKSGGMKKMNPNDPEENPDAFNFGGFDGSPQSFPANSVQTSLDNSSPAAGKYHSEGRYKHRGPQINTYDQHKHISQKSITTSESGSEKGHSDYRRRPKGGRNPSDDSSSRSASVPKFGAWDEKDPKSGESFTVIFNKVKEEKHIAATKFPVMQPQNRNNQETSRNKPRSKKFCGLC